MQVLTRSAEDSLLTFDEKGGVKEVPLTGDRVVLTDEVIRRLVKATREIKRVFGDRDQDIEWAYMKGSDLHRPVAAVSYPGDKDFSAIDERSDKLRGPQV